MFSVGDIRIARIEEVVLPEPTALFAHWSDEALARHRDLLVPHCFNEAAGAFRVSIHSYLVTTPTRKILIDTAAGNGKERPASPRFGGLSTRFLDNLRAAGAAPEEIDMVICTHLHVDHVGWNTRLADGRWVPTFPNATYFLPRLEVEWRDPKRGALNRPPETHLPFIDSVQPILDAGQAVLVEGDDRLSDELDLLPTPGHAPGQIAVRVRSRGKEALFVADIMHQPIQIYFPEWNSKYCENPEVAARTRREILEYCADHASLVLPGHFGFPHGGHIKRRGEGFTFVPAKPKLATAAAPD
jgi:glyoxylase-like metal-dependent hydrolase (beta-lactamase superfamily II)